jgi:hypothetical protein
MMGTSFSFGTATATESATIVAQQIAAESGGVLSATAPVVQAAAQDILQDSMALQLLAMLSQTAQCS